MRVEDVDDRSQRLTETVQENSQGLLGHWVVIFRQRCNRLRGGVRIPTPSCVISSKRWSGEKSFDAAPATAIAAGTVSVEWIMAPLAGNIL